MRRLVGLLEPKRLHETLMDCSSSMNLGAPVSSDLFLATLPTCGWVRCTLCLCCNCSYLSPSWILEEERSIGPYLCSSRPTSVLDGTNASDQYCRPLLQIFTLFWRFMGKAHGLYDLPQCRDAGAYHYVSWCLLYHCPAPISRSQVRHLT